MSGQLRLADAIERQFQLGGIKADLPMLGQQSKGLKNPYGNPYLDPTYASAGTDPKQQYARSLEQQNFARRKIFYPQLKKATDYALDKTAPQKAAAEAEQAAIESNAVTRDQYLRNQQRAGTIVDPRVAAENDRMMALQGTKNVADAGNMAREGTRANQIETLGDVTGLGTGIARQALGLSAGAASMYQQRMDKNAEVQQMQANANAQAMQANLSMAMSTVMSAISIAVTAAAVT